MVRKSERNKNASEKTEKATTSRKSSRASRRRKKSTSESEPEPEVEAKVEAPQPEIPLPEVEEPLESKEPKRTRGRRRAVVAEPVEEPKPVEVAPAVAAPEQKDWKEDEKFWGESSQQPPVETPATEEDKSTWKVQSSNGSGGEIQKLKICRQRVTDSAESSSSPAKETASPKRKRYTKRKTALSADGAESVGSHSDAEAPSSTVTEVESVPIPSENSELPTPVIDSTSLPQEEIPLPTEEIVMREADSATAEIPIPEVSSGPTDEPEDKDPPAEKVVEEAAPESAECSVAEISLSVTVPEPEQEISFSAEPVEVVAPAIPTEANSLPDQPENQKEEIEEGELKQDKKPVPASKPAVSNEDALQQIAKKLNERAARFSKEATEEAARRLSNAKPQKENVVEDEEDDGEVSRDPASTKTLELMRLNEDDVEPCNKRTERQRRLLCGFKLSTGNDSEKENDLPVVPVFNVSTETLKDIMPEAIEPIPEEEVLSLFIPKDDEIETKMSDDDEVGADVGGLLTEEGELIDEEDRRKSLDKDRLETDKTRRSSRDEPKRLERRVIKESKETRKSLKDRKERRSSVDEPKAKKKFEKEESKRIRDDKRDSTKHQMDKPELLKSDTNHKPIRKIAIVSDDSLSVRRSISPPSKTPSDVLFITNLVRPFTIGQLRELLARTGTIAQDGFYIDKIKSKCYVKYNDVEMAVETRHALHGVRWPLTNPRTLRVEFSTDEAMEAVKKLAEEEDNAAQIQEKTALKNDRGGWLSEKDVLKPTRKPKNAVREWDMGKESDLNLPAEKMGKEDEWGVKAKDKRVEKDGVGKRRLGSPVTMDKSEPVKKIKKRDAEAPAKLLDDLFKRTNATPCIYWLPLTAAQIAVKEEIRRQHMAEHQKRLEELKKSESLRRDKDKSRDRDRERDRYRDRRRK